MQFAAEKGFAMQILTKSDYMMKVALGNKASLAQAITNVAAIGLTLNPAEKLAYLIPRKGIICLDPSYMGLIRLATDAGSIRWCQAKIVRENDTFTIEGVDKEPTHKYSPFGDRGEVVGVYCIAKALASSSPPPQPPPPSWLLRRNEIDALHRTVSQPSPRAVALTTISSSRPLTPSTRSFISSPSPACCCWCGACCCSVISSAAVLKLVAFSTAGRSARSSGTNR